MVTDNYQGEAAAASRNDTAGEMSMVMSSDGFSLRREGPESEPPTAYPAPKGLRAVCRDGIYMEERRVRQ